jgi:hypothetical protein
MPSLTRAGLAFEKFNQGVQVCPLLGLYQPLDHLGGRHYPA